MERIPENKVIDFVDGKTLRNRTPEEYVRQNIARSLVHEYRYLRSDLEIEFRIKLGSVAARVDIALFEEGQPHKQEYVIGIIECKREGISETDKRDGLGQLKSYLAACPNCRFGMWTNGTNQRICLGRSIDKGTVHLDPLIDIPSKGQTQADPDAPNRRFLRPATADNLLFAFKRCHNYIAGNQGLQKPEAFWELLKVIFCKTQDERSSKGLEFYVTTSEQRTISGQLKCKARLDHLFESVRRDFPTIFAPNDEINLSKDVLAYIVAQLQPYSLLESSVDVKGVAYEEIVGSNLRGDRGEFFTPRNACRMAVSMLKPTPGSRIIDPACGTGGFLITAMNWILDKFDSQRRELRRDVHEPTHIELQEDFRARQKLLAETIVGLDINPSLVRAAKMNMVMNNDGSGGLAQANSLHDPVTWSDQARRIAVLGSFDYVFTNPPFGTNIRIDSPDILGQYELGTAWELDAQRNAWRQKVDGSGAPILQSSQPPEILFIERCVQLLKPGTGVMAMVIPNGILNNLSLGYVRQWILSNTQVLAVIDMQRDLFQPRNDTQTSMVLLRRFTNDEKQQLRDYQVFFAVTKKVGHDKRGNAIYVRDADGQDILAERTITAQVVEHGKYVERAITEKVQIVDDELPLVPDVFAEWRRQNGIVI